VQAANADIGGHLAVRANPNLDIQLGVLIPIPLNREELVEQIVQAAVDGLGVHQEACLPLLNGSSDVPNHAFLGFS